MSDELVSLGIPSSLIYERFAGGNSEVVKFKNHEEKFRALKIYRGDQPRVSQMFEKETKALSFLHYHGFRNVPQQVLSHPNLKAIEYDWIEGEIAGTTDACLVAIVGMLNSLKKLTLQNHSFDNAVDSINAPSDIIAQILSRISRLKEKNSRYVYEVKKKINVFRNTENIDVPCAQRILSMSDLGAHNVITQNKDFFFIDFEFFGYDSFAKLWGDFLLHPRNHFSTRQISQIEPSIDLNWTLARQELVKCLPALALKWSLIARGRAERNLVSVQNEDETTKLYWRSEKYLEFFDFLQEHKDDAPFMTFCEYANEK